MNCKYNTDEERKEAIKQSQAKYRASEKARKNRQEYYQKVVKPNQEKMQKMQEYSKEYNKEYCHLERVKEMKRKKAVIKYKSDKNFRKKVNERTRKYYEENKDKVLDYQHNYYLEHKEEIAERKRQWRLRRIMEAKN